jgi:hypothetical protein
MSKIIIILLVLAVVATLLVAIDPGSRARAMETWEQVKSAWADFSKDFSASMSTLIADFRERFGETGSLGSHTKHSSAS